MKNLPSHVIAVPGHLVYELWKKGFNTWETAIYVSKNLSVYKDNGYIAPKNTYDPKIFQRTEYTNIAAKPVLYQLTCKLRDIL